MALRYDDMAKHPVSSGSSSPSGLRYEGKWRRARPKTLVDAAKPRSAGEAGSLRTKPAAPTCRSSCFAPTTWTDASNRQSLFAFKLHQFISGGGKVYATLEPPASVPSRSRPAVRCRRPNPARALHVHFCRDCGQEYIPVWDSDGSEGRRFSVATSKSASTRTRTSSFGFLMPDASGVWEHARSSATRKRGSKSARMANGASSPPTASSCLKPCASGQMACFRQDGRSKAWFIPGGFRFLPGCGTAHTAPPARTRCD
jgi:hypothetical protein